MAKFKFLGYLEDNTSVREKEVVLEKPMPLREIIHLPFPEDRVIVLIDDKVGNFDSVIKNDNIGHCDADYFRGVGFPATTFSEWRHNPRNGKGYLVSSRGGSMVGNSFSG